MPAHSVQDWLRAGGMWGVVLGMGGLSTSAQSVAREIGRLVWMAALGALGALLRAIADAARRWIARRVSPW